MKKSVIFLVFLCVIIFLSAVIVSADDIAAPAPYSVIIEDGDKIIYITPTEGEAGESRPKSGLYYNEDPPRNIYYFDDYFHEYNWYLHESSLIFSKDGVFAVHIP